MPLSWNHLAAVGRLVKTPAFVAMPYQYRAALRFSKVGQNAEVHGEKRIARSHRAATFQILFDPLNSNTAPTAMPMGKHRFWGVPNMTARLLNGFDDKLKTAILTSGKWSGNEQDLDNILKKQSLSHPPAPMRDAVDFTYSCILSPIKTLKFSHYSQTY